MDSNDMPSAPTNACQPEDWNDSSVILRNLKRKQSYLIEQLADTDKAIKIMDEMNSRVKSSNVVSALELVELLRRVGI